MSTDLPVEALAGVATVFEDLGIEYYIGGQIRLIAQAVGANYYLNEHAMRQAVVMGQTFNVIHLASMYKVDVFAFKDRTFDEADRTRIVHWALMTGDSRKYPLASPEDVILNKLEWFRDGDDVSDRQWQDVLGIIRVRGEQLEWDYLLRWAQVLKLTELLDRARSETE